MAVKYEPYQLDQILSLLTDQRETITLRSIMLELTVNRSVARVILQEIARLKCGDGDDKYQVVRMVSSRSENGRMRMELVSDNASKSDNEGSSIFSIALLLPTDNEDDDDDVDEHGNPTIANTNNDTSILEQVIAAHEKAMATQRDKLGNCENGELLDIFGDLSILPANEFACHDETEMGSIMKNGVRHVKRGRDTMHLSSVERQPGNDKNGNDKKVAKANSSSTAAAAAVGSVITTKGKKKGKPTTAAAFFGSQTTATKKKDKKPNDKKPKNGKSDSKKKEAAEEESQEEVESTTEKKSKPKNEIEQQHGNADDFIGDIDEDDDFVELDKQRKSRLAKKAAPKKRRKREIPENDEKDIKEDTNKAVTKEDVAEEISDNEDMEYDDVITKKGAMDAFAKKKQPNGGITAPASSNSNNTTGGSSKKRRKKLVEQMTVGDDGYMRTETVTVWEDVEEEDDAVDEKKKKLPAAAAASKSKNKPSGGSGGATSSKSKKSSGSGVGKKKQAGLMGFFAKKK